jgi:hypothetical protein
MSDLPAALLPHLQAGQGRSLAMAAARLFAPFPGADLDPFFAAALFEELFLRGDVDAAALTAEVAARGVIATVHHLCPTSGPTFGAIEQLCAQAPPGPILLFAWAGLPMSNSAVSGALCFGAGPIEALVEAGPQRKAQIDAARDRSRDGEAEGRLRLIPAAWRDALVDGCPMPESVGALLGALTPAARAALATPRPGETYAAWALRTNEGIARAHTGRDLIFVDLSRVGARAVCAALAEPGHPLRALTGRGDLGLPWALERVGARIRTHPTLGEVDIEALRAGALSVGLLPVMALLRCFSRIRLLGGFRQVVYAPALAAAVGERGAEDGLLTGRLVDEGGRGVYPFDLARGAARLEPPLDPTTPLARLWAPLGFAPAPAG